MIIAEAPSPIDGLASAASVLLVIEASLIVILLAAIALLLAFGLRWVQQHVTPLLRTTVPRVNSALGATDRTLGQLIDLLADLYGRRRGAERVIRAFLEAVFPSVFTATAADGQHATPDAPAADGALSSDA